MAALVQYPSSIGGFIIGFSPIGIQPTTLTNLPVTVQNVIPAYLYQEYADDEQVQAFFDAYNAYAQAYLDYLNNLNLPIYTNGNISGPLLDWVATYLYGFARPTLEQGVASPPMGPMNTWPMARIPINSYTPARSPSFFNTTDDIYKRILTWLFYKGDGKVFTPEWLKRRINRFLTGLNGQDVDNQSQYDISVAPTGFKAWTITLPSANAMSNVLQAAIAVGACELPFQITWSVSVV